MTTLVRYALFFFGAFVGLTEGLNLVGFLHGAYYEGLDMANNIAGCIKTQSCTGLPHVDEVKN
jgi:polyamine oxidase